MPLSSRWSFSLSIVAVVHTDVGHFGRTTVQLLWEDQPLRSVRLRLAVGASFRAKPLSMHGRALKMVSASWP